MKTEKEYLLESGVKMHWFTKQALDNVIKAMNKYARAKCNQQKNHCAKFIDLADEKSPKALKKIIPVFQDVIKLTPNATLK